VALVTGVPRYVHTFTNKRSLSNRWDESYTLYYKEPAAVLTGAFKTVCMIKNITQIFIFCCRVVKVPPPEYEISDKRMALVIKQPYRVHSVSYNKPPAVPFGDFQLVYTITKITQMSIFCCREVKASYI
jgi:hypothetical protein